MRQTLITIGLACLLGVAVSASLDLAGDAAAAADTHAQVELGRMYEQGFGAKPDRLMAYVWYDIAANEGDAAGSQARNRLAQSLSPAQLFEAQQVERSISRYVESPAD